MTAFTVAGQPVVVLGAARSGVAAALLLAERGARVTLSDLRPAPLGDADADRLRQAGVALELGGHAPATLAAASLIVLSPGVPPAQPALDAARRAGIPIVGEIEVASRWLRGRVVAITGTKGKSTTTVLAGRMLEAGGFRTLVGGNLGVPLSAQVAESTPETIHVVEVSSFQLETTDRFRPWIAVLLNLTPDHLDRHASPEDYARAKARIFRNQTEDDWAVINADDPHVLELARAARARRVLCSVAEPGEGEAVAAIEHGIVLREGALAYRRDGREAPVIPLSAVRLGGRHLLADVAAAAAVATLSGVSAADMTRAVAAFEGLEHVLEPVAEVRGVRFVNDTKATNVDAARRAVESVEGGLVLILGGRYKGGDFGVLAPLLAARAGRVVAIGEARPLIRDALAATVPVREAASMAEAVEQAWTWAAPGDTVLLAPACASLDMFADYADRGRAFKAAVAGLRTSY